MSLDGGLVDFQIVLGSGSDSKETFCIVGDLDSIPGLGRSPGEGNDNQFQCSCLEKEMATLSSTLAWITPQTEESGRL